MNRKLIFLMFIVLSLPLFAQKYSITGKIIDKQTNENMMFANCVLHYQTDTLGIYKGETSDTAGSFVFKNVKKRNLILEITYVGYKTYKRNIDTNNFQNERKIDLGTILLERQDDLQQIEIVAQRKRIEVDDDKMYVNIDEQMAGSVSNAFDLLRLVPGVMIDGNENLKLDGKSGVQFQYNGREMKIGWEGIKSMLKSMPADMIDQFEIIKDPGVRYSSEGTAGIINIKMKKNKNYGINGSVTMDGGYKDSLNYSIDPSFRLNFVNDKWMISAGYSYRKSWSGNIFASDSSQRYTAYNEDTILFRRIPDEYKYKRSSHYTDFTASYSIDSTQTIDFSANYYYISQPWYTTRENTYMSHYPNYFLSDSLYSDIDGSDYNNKSLSLALSWVKKLDTNDAKLSSDLDFSYDKTSETSANTINYYLGESINPSSLYRSQGYKTSPEDKSQDFSWRIDYYKPMGDNARFEAGLKTNYSFSDRNYDAYVLDAENYIVDNMLTNHFKYTENINSLYASLTHKFFKKKLSLRAGIRFEQTNTKGEQTVLDSVNTRHYFNVFPNLRVAYKFAADNELSANYSYRISRPWSTSLNPFVSKSSDYSYSSGNPYLEPEYSHRVSLSHSWKYMLFTTLAYSYSKNDISWVSNPLDSTYQFNFNPLAIIRHPVNFGSSKDVDLNVAFSKSITMMWNVNINAGVNYQNINSSDAILEEIDRDNWSWNLSVNSFLMIPKWNLRGFFYYTYRSSSLSGTRKSNGWNFFMASIGKTFLEDKLSVNLSVNWMSFGVKNYSEEEYMNSIIKSWRRTQRPSFNLSVSYKFGKFYQQKRVEKQQLEDFDSRAGKKE